MTDELTGGVSTPADTPSVAPETSVPQVAPPEPTPRAAIDRAFASLDAAENGDDSTDHGQDVPSGNRERNPDGTFKAKEASQPTEKALEPVKAEKPTTDQPKDEAGADEAPSRFSPDAKAAWKDAPPAIKAEVKRAFTELEQGIEKYRGDAQEFDSVRDFAKLAKDNGTTLRGGLERYVSFEMAINKDPVQGILSVCEDKGIDPRQIAQAILGQKAEAGQGGQQNAELLRTINNLNAKIAQLEQGVSTIRGQSVEEKLNSFVSSLDETDAGLFEELGEQIAQNISQGKSLPDAFAAAKEAEKQRVERLAPRFGLNPQPPVPAPVPKPDPSSQTRKGQLSVTGAPGSGSNPDARKTPSSAREALDNAFATIGL